jgi:hypothetical protein
VVDHTDAVAIEIARLLGNGQEEGKLVPALAGKFPDLTAAALDEAIRELIALRDVVAAESDRELTQIKAELSEACKAPALRLLELKTESFTVRGSGVARAGSIGIGRAESRRARGAGPEATGRGATRITPLICGGLNAGEQRESDGPSPRARRSGTRCNQWISQRWNHRQRRADTLAPQKRAVEGRPRRTGKGNRHHRSHEVGSAAEEVMRGPSILAKVERCREVQVGVFGWRPHRL